MVFHESNYIYIYRNRGAKEEEEREERERRCVLVRGGDPFLLLTVRVPMRPRGNAAVGEVSKFMDMEPMKTCVNIG